jgi:hypothetical protein
MNRSTLADLAAAYQAVTEAAPFFDAPLGLGLALAIEAGEQPTGWPRAGAVDEAGTDRAMPGKTRTYERTD